MIIASFLLLKILAVYSNGTSGQWTNNEKRSPESCEDLSHGTLTLPRVRQRGLNVLSFPTESEPPTK